MIVLFLALVALAGLHAFFTDRQLRREQARVSELLTLLEAKAAPAEHAAYVLPRYEDPNEGLTWLTSPDGLVTVGVSSDG